MKDIEIITDNVPVAASAASGLKYGKNDKKWRIRQDANLNLQSLNIEQAIDSWCTGHGTCDE